MIAAVNQLLNSMDPSNISIAAFPTELTARFNGISGPVAVQRAQPPLYDSQLIGTKEENFLQTGQCAIALSRACYQLTQRVCSDPGPDAGLPAANHC